MIRFLTRIWPFRLKSNGLVRSQGRPGSNIATRHKRRLELEPLESREALAALTFASPAAIYGTAKLNSSMSGTVKSLLSFNTDDMAHRSNAPSKAFTSLTNNSGASSNQHITLTTSAKTAGTKITSAQAFGRTTATGGGFSYVTVRVVPTTGEVQGQAVKVTLSASFVSTIGVFNSGTASNTYFFDVNGQHLLRDTTKVKGTRTYSKNVLLHTTIGSTFQVAFQSKSNAGFAGSYGKSNLAGMQFSLSMSVSTTSGGGNGHGAVGGGSGGGSAAQYSAPAAPNKPSWSSAGGRDIYLYWNDVVGETSYVIQWWYTKTNEWVHLSTYDANTTSVKIINGLDWYFTVGATNSFGTSFSPYVLAQSVLAQ